MVGIGSGRMKREKKWKNKAQTENGDFSDMAKFMRKEGRTKTTESVGKEQKEQSNQTDDTYKNERRRKCVEIVGRKLDENSTMNV
jgi:hypothetical protein